MKKTALLIALSGLVFITLPVFFERLHSDEVVFWEVAKNLAQGHGLVSETAGRNFFSLHMPLPFLVVAPFLKLSSHIFTSRVISSLFTVAAAVLIFLIAGKKTGRAEATVSAALFLLSYHALRFGGRFYLDQYGVFFFLLALYFHVNDSPLLSGVSAVAAVFAREYWLLVYPFFFIYAAYGRKSVSVFLMPAALLATSFLTVFLTTGGAALGSITPYLTNGAAAKNLTAAIIDALYGAGIMKLLARAWAEFFVINFLIIIGFFIYIASRRGKYDRIYLLLVIPQAFVLSLIHGFILDGGVTQYPLSLVATLSVFSGAGLKAVYDRFSGGLLRRVPFAAATLAVIALQFISLNAFATAVSLHKNTGVYGFGYKDDEKVIEMLKRNARGQFIHGIHGAFVEDRSRWDWTDYRIKEAIEEEPDWLITFANYVEILPEAQWKDKAALYNIGPYVIVRSLRKGSLRLAVRQKDFPKWLLKGR